jgi:stage V sporulation protein R
MPTMARWTHEQIQDLIQEVYEYVLQEGLDPLETVFEIVDYETMNQLAAYAGFPKRYPHWSFGMEYEYIRQSYRYGLHRIYEMVVNNDPAYAYLLESNTLVDQKMVIAHVFAHSDFFKNNTWFSKSNRKMIDTMANHEATIQTYIERYGPEEVESFLDICLSLEDLIDFHSLFIPRKSRQKPEEVQPRPTPVKLKVPRPYLDPYINPPEFIEAQKQQHEKKRQTPPPFPIAPEKDVLLFLIEHAPLENWQKVILSIIRDESYYFAPQRATKIMNEGWATFWHSRIMTRYLLKDSEVVEYADKHSGVLAAPPHRLNPYKLGYELWKDIEERWNKGRFGPEWEACDDMRVKAQWDRKLGLGLQKIFEVRRFANDLTFIDQFLTEEFCARHKLFVYQYNRETGYYEIKDWDYRKVKQQLLLQLTNFGKPIIYVQDGNYKNRGELYLKHKHEGVDLDIPYAKETLKNIYALWKRPVHLETVIQNRRRVLTYDGGSHLEVQMA